MSNPTNNLFIDTQDQEENFLFETTEGSTPTLRVYIFNNATAISLTATQTAKFIYAVKRESSEMVEVDGTLTVGNGYVDFEFTAAKTAINGKFFASVILYDNGGADIIVQSDGMIILKRNPALSGATPLDTTTTVNWSLITNVGLLPWAIGNEVTSYSNCSASPYQVTVTDSAKTQIVNADCDFAFILPKATTANIGRCYGFLHTRRAYTLTLRASEGDVINETDDGGQVTSVRNYVQPSSMYLRQTTANRYDTIFADGAFLTEASEWSSSSSSSSSYSSSSSSSSSVDSSSSSSV